MILGALVADAAALGLHWIYDQAHIRKIAPDTPEFRAPLPKNYDGVKAFFAHPSRKAGEQSQYGEQTMVMLRALVANGRRYDAAQYADAFRAHFGYGGAYVGYIDHATRDTLDNFRRYEDAAQACATTLPFNGEARVVKTLVSKALPLIARHTDQDLATAFEASVRDTYDDEDIIIYSAELLAALRRVPRPSGAHDLQLPAIAKLPALVAHLVSQGITEGDAFARPVASAIRTTSDHPTAAEFGMLSAQMMAAALTHGTIDAVLATRTAASDGACALLDQAIEMRDADNATVTKHFGMACDLPYGVPSALHNIATAHSYQDAVQRNIYGGGDSCGRAILVGAIMGAVKGSGGVQGIPENWIKHLYVSDEATSLIDTLFT